jgi:periplasmic protein TonB
VTDTHATATVPTQTVAPPPTETRAALPPPPPPPTETVARAHEGDLVTGGEGLTAAHLVRLAPAEYPGLARAQRVEGLVLMSVLVSETGQVLQVKLIRGVNKPVGLNEAAEAAVRRSTFAPGMKDGVRVKSWMTVPINFKL